MAGASARATALALLLALTACSSLERGPSPGASRRIAALGGRALAGSRPGKALLVIGGTHGDEASGQAATLALASGPPPARGLLLVLPGANPGAVASGQRTGPDGLDLNRLYPGRPAGMTQAGHPGPGPLEARAAAIFSLALKADLTVDLHEEGLAWTEADRPTLVISPAAAELAMDLVDRLGLEGIQLAFTGGSPAGSLVAELGRRGRRALTVEIPASLPLEERTRLQLSLVAALEGLLGLAP